MLHFQQFKTDISGIALPKNFTFPFYYEPHPLAIIATNELQSYLENQRDFNHNFGLDKHKEGMAVGKMFGVLVVKNERDEIGYLAAFSGTLSDKSNPMMFVPPVFNMRTYQSFYLKGEEELNAINQNIVNLKENQEYTALLKLMASKKISVHDELKKQKAKMKLSKKERQSRRIQAEKELPPVDFEGFNKKLEQESFNDQFLYKELAAYRNQQLAEIQHKLDSFEVKISALKAQRKQKSTLLQRRLFENYQFLNQKKEEKGLTEIFPNYEEQQPPSGSGDCSAPKLLQYAFANQLQPIALAEFWWGKSPNAEIRKHKHFYPACQSRCKPILAHMLAGIKMDKNPLLTEPDQPIDLEIIYEDEAIIIVNKPPEFLSVPGKELTDSVYTRIKNKYPSATGPLIVHRLDMSTSGILVLTKTKEANAIVQKQFINRSVKKRYTALLDGIIQEDEGEINLPLRVDLDDRPRQMVCYDHGKKAITKWKVVDRKNGKTKIHFFPITGRTHQLRVHAAHPLGLNTPIIGDDLYGQKANRLHLHAAHIQFTHPTTNKIISFTVEADF